MYPKFFWSLLVTLLLMSPALAEDTLHGGATWTEDAAREEALKNLEPSLNVKAFEAKDPAWLENLTALDHDTLKVSRRNLTRFAGGYYAVVNDGENIVNYYKQDGSLFKVSVCSVAFGGVPSYPRKCVEYAYPEGRFLTVSLDVAPDESFVFATNGDLKHHWKGETGFDATGAPRWERW